MVAACAASDTSARADAVTTVRKTSFTCLNLVLLFGGRLTSQSDTGRFSTKGQPMPATDGANCRSTASSPSWTETIHPTATYQIKRAGRSRLHPAAGKTLAIG